MALEHSHISTTRSAPASWKVATLWPDVALNDVLRRDYCLPVVRADQLIDPDARETGKPSCSGIGSLTPVLNIERTTFDGRRQTHEFCASRSIVATIIAFHRRPLTIPNGWSASLSKDMETEMLTSNLGRCRLYEHGARFADYDIARTQAATLDSRGRASSCRNHPAARRLNLHLSAAVTTPCWPRKATTRAGGLACVVSDPGRPLMAARRLDSQHTAIERTMGLADGTP